LIFYSQLNLNEMKTVSLSGSLRGNVGKKDAKKARNQGLTPCVVYGGKEQVHCYVEEKAFKPILFTPESFLIKLEVGGKTYDVILQDVQYHPVTDSLLHADFLEVVPGKPVKTAIPVTLTGTSKGVLRGGRLIKKFRKLSVKGLIDDIPEKVVVDITKLDIGDSIKISNLKVENIEFLDPQSAMVVTVRTARVVVTADEEAEEGSEGEEGGETPAQEGEGEAKE
jgi:large subunit ribosomal protein L25